MKIYLDMDDVVADWMEVAFEITGMRWQYGERIPDDKWRKLNSYPRFYRDLPLKPGATELVEYCQDLLSKGEIDNLFFLTALPHDSTMPFASYDKVHWGDRHFPGIPVFIGPYSHDKWRHCQPGDILIDDRHSNCSEWRSAGGLAHEYRNWNECKEWLEGVLYDQQNP
jgi:5'(3')-deoxyribonucleotidase